MDRTIWSFMGVLLLCAVLVFNLVLNVSGNAEVDALNAFKTNVADPSNVFQSWNATHVNPCAWYHVTCNSHNSVTYVHLGNANISGQLVPQLGQLQNLQYLELYSNSITGKIPAELGNLTNLVSLDLYSNRISGSIPETLGRLQKLRFLRLYNNSLTGVIPMALTTVYSLQVLDLSNNQLEGDIPVNGSFQSFDQLSFADNPHLRPKVLPPGPVLPTPSGNTTTGAIAGGVGAAALSFTVSVIALVCYYRKWNPIASCWKRRLSDYAFDVSAAKDFEAHFCQLKKFPLHELQAATDNFSDKNFLGRGGFGKVYKGLLTDGSFVAVKRLQAEGTQGGELQFQTEVIMLSSAVHRNLLRLRGFCMTSTERLLVYPFMANGSVASCLQDRPKSKPPLEWPIRKKIALGAAKGLAYLHGDCNPKIIHRAVKAANILLDEEYEAIVGDFGLAKLMDYKDTHVTIAVRGTNGYIAPEYLSTGRISEKTDVFGYGVMLLELITGQRAFDLARRAVGDNVMLLDWVKELWKDKRLETLIDADLGGEYNEEEVEQVIQVALLCTQGSALERPKMSEVMKMLEGDGLAQKWDQWQKNEINTPNNYTLLHNANWMIVDSASHIPPDELSGPR